MAKMIELQNRNIMVKCCYKCNFFHYGYGHGCIIETKYCELGTFCDSILDLPCHNIFNIHPDCELKNYKRKVTNG
jgi:hypothetical protein